MIHFTHKKGSTYPSPFLSSVICRGLAASRGRIRRGKVNRGSGMIQDFVPNVLKLLTLPLMVPEPQRGGRDL
jgi:hypothetical protein